MKHDPRNLDTYADGFAERDELHQWARDMKRFHRDLGTSDAPMPKACPHCGRYGEHEWDHRETCPHYREMPLPF